VSTYGQSDGISGKQQQSSMARSVSGGIKMAKGKISVIK